MGDKDLTVGSIPLLVGKLALPVFVAFVMQSLYQLADLYFVGKLGAQQLAGMSIAVNTNFIVLALGMTFGVGSLALISRAYGGGGRAEIPVLFQQALWMSLAAGGALWLAAYLSAVPFVATFTEDPVVLQAGVAYFSIITATLLTQLLLMVATFAFRAVGDFITPTLLMAVGVVLNVGLDPVLIFGLGPFPRMGVAGAAVATVFTQAIGLALVGWVVVAHSRSALTLRRPFVLRLDLMARMLRIGVPSGLQFLLFAITMLVTYRFVRPYGGDATAAVGVGYRVIETGILPVVSVGMAVSSLVGQNLGAHRYDRMRAAALCGLAYGVAITLAEFTLLAWHPAFWVSLFTGDPGVQAVGAQYLSIVGLSLLLLGLDQPIVSVSVGLGRTLLPLVAQVLRMVTFLGALALLVGVWGLGLPGIFWSRALALVPEVLFLCGVLAFWWGTVLRASPQAEGPVAPEPAPAEAG